MILATLLFILGIIILLVGAEALVRGASSIAMRSNISPLVIGMTIVAFGTSTPELVVAITSIVNQSADIGVGNIIGTNIANILLALGIAALVGKMSASPSLVKRELPFLIIISALLLLLSFDALFMGSANMIGRLDGVVLLALFGLFMGYVYRLSRRPESIGTKLFQFFRFNERTYPYIVSAGMTLAGLAGLVIGATLTVDGAEVIARAIGIPELVIGLTVVAVGTSLPELATTVVAVYRRNADLAIGNIIGSNIFNILWVIGVASVVSPLAVSNALLINIGIAVLAPIILLVALLAGKLQMGRVAGVIFLVLYIAYIVFLVLYQ